VPQQTGYAMKALARHGDASRVSRHRNWVGGDNMAARKTWRRTITVQGHRFLWYVADDPDGMGRVLHLFTPDKALVATYWLECKRSYPGNPALMIAKSGVRQIIRDAPDWAPRSVATPGFVAEVARWMVQWQDQPGNAAEPS